MRTKIVYCLVSDDTDYYYEQLLISLYSLRKYNPDAEVVLVVDEETSVTLVDKRTKVFELVSQVVKFNVPEKYSKKMRSRYIKTSLREIVVGDYLYIDTDTVIFDSLEDIDSCTYEIGAVLDNHHGLIIEKQLNYLPEGHEWHSLKGSKHYNSGVFFVKDTPKTHAFYLTWNKYWKESAEIGILFDQMPLRKTVLEFDDICIGELNGIWNCQAFRADSKPYWENVKIFHCQGVTKNEFFPMTASYVYEKIKRIGTIPFEIRNMIDNEKKNLLKKNAIIKEKDIDFYNSPMHFVYLHHPMLFSFFIKEFEICRNISGVVRNVKNKVRKIYSVFHFFR